MLVAVEQTAVRVTLVVQQQRWLLTREGKGGARVRPRWSRVQRLRFTDHGKTASTLCELLHARQHRRHLLLLPLVLGAYLSTTIRGSAASEFDRDGDTGSLDSDVGSRHLQRYSGYQT